MAKEVRPTSFVDDRIDLLAGDKEGSCVVIEIKRGSHKFHLLQALSYAAMVSKWPQDRIVTEYSSLVGKATEEGTDYIEQFLNVDVETLNTSQRVLLLAENFDYEVLVTAEWLSEKLIWTSVATELVCPPMEPQHSSHAPAFIQRQNLSNMRFVAVGLASLTDGQIGRWVCCLGK